jgi:adenylate cyclase
VQPSGSRVRASAQIISAETGAHIWADQFDADRADLLQMQDEIVTRRGRTLEFDIARAARTHPGNPSAEDLARQCFAKEYSNPPPDYSLCERALQIDPRNALALKGMAWKSIWPVYTAQSTEQEEIRRPDELVTQAIAVDPGARQVPAWRASAAPVAGATKFMLSRSSLSHKGS